MPAEIIEVKTQDQLDACIQIRQAVFVQEQNVPAELEVDEYDRLDAHSMHVLLMMDGQYIATGRIKLIDEFTAKMQRVAVLAAYRGGGNGRSLMLGLEQLARLHGVESCILDAQCHAEGFYQSMGYLTTSDEPFYDAGILHVRMQKKL
ncbi:MAG: GNAT family N-acetyltransferase [Paenibacillus sp.]|uniref:GNAT family N-acetyltransferase n=1 Tax=Paenibacillus aquistagni TaxID=1852522 RepID=UPI000B5078E1|nr:GNAT family N-acetyltransferase [Paenibacillus aquistagni]MBR2569117.1 GNAT family N-acetyltransferase [Paenibacillus sp.]NMM51415.1 GNAT family N-acetyltransferase [Paenibacillus aquistagni]